MASRKGTWSSLELARLHELFPRSEPHRLARLLGRTTTSVMRRGKALFAGEPRRRAWDGVDERRLREAIGVHDVATIAILLRRPIDDVAARIAALATERRSGAWTGEEIALLKRLFGTRSPSDLALALSRCPADSAARAADLRLGKDKAVLSRGDTGRAMPRWTPGDVAKLRQLYPRRDNLEIARILGRTVASVTNKAFQLGLSKSARALAAMGRRNGARRSR